VHKSGVRTPPNRLHDGQVYGPLKTEFCETPSVNRPYRLQTRCRCAPRLSMRLSVISTDVNQCACERPSGFHFDWRENSGAGPTLTGFSSPSSISVNRPDSPSLARRVAGCRRRVIFMTVVPAILQLPQNSGRSRWFHIAAVPRGRIRSGNPNLRKVRAPDGTSRFNTQGVRGPDFDPDPRT